MAQVSLIGQGFHKRSSFTAVSFNVTSQWSSVQFLLRLGYYSLLPLSRTLTGNEKLFEITEVEMFFNHKGASYIKIVYKQ